MRSRRLTLARLLREERHEEVIVVGDSSGGSGSGAADIDTRDHGGFRSDSGEVGTAARRHSTGGSGGSGGGGKSYGYFGVGMKIGHVVKLRSHLRQLQDAQAIEQRRRQPGSRASSRAVAGVHGSW